MMPVHAYIALGSNLTDPAQQVLRAFDALNSLPNSRLIARSSLYLTAPVGYADQPDFINAVAHISTQLAPHALLDALLAIEHQFGRERTFQNAPRILDLDVLLYDNVIQHEAGLTLPHPRMHERAFVLVPLAEIAPALTIPGRGAISVDLVNVQNQDLQRVADNWQAPPRKDSHHG